MGGACCALGSSTVWGPTYTDNYEASQIFADPEFADYTAVYAMYCDGGSWTGNLATPVTVGNATIHYKGRPLLDALIDWALDGGLSTASNLLYGGCSAGGLTSYLHADYVASRMPPSVKTVAIADAMFSANTKTWNGGDNFPASMEWGFKAWNASGSTNDACEAAYGASDAWQCFFGQNVAKHVQTPMFVLNSKYDSWQGPALIGCSTPIKNCTPAAQTFWIKCVNRCAHSLTTLVVLLTIAVFEISTCSFHNCNRSIEIFFLFLRSAVGCIFRHIHL